jgi:hypothetical protein
MLPSPGSGLRVVSVSVQVTPVRVHAVVDAWLGHTGAGKLHDVEIVAVIEVVELWGPQHLRFLIESGVFAELQVIEVAELIERNYFGDFVAMEV